MSWARDKLELATTYTAKGLGFGLGVTVVMELFDLRVVLLLQSGVGQ